MLARKIIPQEIRDVLSYCPDTGEIRLTKSRGNRKAGAAVGSVGFYGYVAVGFNKKIYFAHRLAWFLHYAEQPPEIIDHINGDKADNRIANLRKIDAAGNRINSVSRGVSWNKKNKSWAAQFKRKYLYQGPDLFEAWCRRKSAENKYWASHQNPTAASIGVQVS